MSELIKHHINEVMDIHCLTKGKMGYSVVYYANDVDKVIAEKDNEIRRLKRALWLARSYRGRDNSILLPSKFMRNAWDNVERKCLKKAEQYK